MASDTATNGNERQAAEEPRKGKLPCAPWTLGGPMEQDDDCQPITGDENFDNDRDIAPEHRVGCALYGELYRRLARDGNAIAGELDVGWYRDWMRRTAAYAPFADQDLKNFLDQLFTIARDWRKRSYEVSHLQAQASAIVADGSDRAWELGQKLDEMFVARAKATRDRAEQWTQMWRELIGWDVAEENRQIIRDWRERRREWHKHTPIVGSL